MSAPGGPLLKHVRPETIRVPGRPQVTEAVHHYSRAQRKVSATGTLLKATCSNSGATKGNDTAWTVHRFRHEVTAYVRWRLEADIQMGTDGERDNVCFGSKGEYSERADNFRFAPISGHHQARTPCRKSARSRQRNGCCQSTAGHRQISFRQFPNSEILAS